MEEVSTIQEQHPLQGELIPMHHDTGELLISHLVAASENNVIGNNNQLPWHLPNDFKFFKNKTWGMPVIMGRNTFESLAKTLPGRFNITITSQPGWTRDGVIVAHSIEEGIEKAKQTDCKEIFIIGGGTIFEQSMELANRIYITRVHTTVKGDTFYPFIDPLKWEMVSQDHHFADDKHTFDYTFQTWEKSEKRNVPGGRR